jgi:hypothetical protein
MKKRSWAGKVAHDFGLSTWFGGTLFGQVSPNPTVSSIGDEAERRRVLNEAWGRFQAANLPAMLSTLLGWRLGDVRDDSQLRAPGLTRTKDILLGGAVVNTIASALLGASTAASSRGSHARPLGHQTLAADPARGGARLAAAAVYGERLAGTAGGHSRRLGPDRGGRAQAAWPPLAPSFGLAQMRGHRSAWTTTLAKSTSLLNELVGADRPFIYRVRCLTCYVYFASSRHARRRSPPRRSDSLRSSGTLHKLAPTKKPRARGTPRRQA